jgi:DoxX-like family
MVAIYDCGRQKASESSRRRRKDMATAATTGPFVRTSASAKIGWALSGLAILFLGIDAGAKLLVPAMMAAYSPPQLRIPMDADFYRLLGTILAFCTALYAVPRTAFLGAVLLTAYLGGAVATHLSAGSPLLSNTLFGVYLGLAVWGGLWLRDPRIRALLPLRD